MPKSKIRVEDLQQGLESNNDVLTYRGDLGVWNGQSNLILDTIYANGSITTNTGLVLSSNSKLTANGSDGTSGQVLTSNGSGVYWSNTASANASIVWSISASGTSDYIFSGPGIGAGNANDPILYLYRGFTYTFVNTTGGSHPFAIRVSNGGAAYTSGVTGSQTGTQTFVVPMDAPNTLYYQCTFHGSMGNIINILDNDTQRIDTAYSNAVSVAAADATNKAANAYSNAVLYTNQQIATRANTTSPSFSGTVSVVNLVVSNTLLANSVPGNNGQVLTSTGSGVYWSTPSSGGFTNGQSISVSNLAVTDVATIGGLSANGSTGTAGQILTSNGTSTYWSTSANAQQLAATAYSNAVAYAASNTYVNTQLGLKANLASPTFTGTVTLPTVSANGDVGNTGQVLTSNGSGVYWADASSGDGAAAAAYANAVIYADSKSSDAFTNAVAYTDTNFLPTNAILETFAPLASPAFSGTITLSPRLLANGSSGSTGQVLTSGGTSNIYWTTPANAAQLATAAYSNAIAYSGNAALAYANAIAYSGNAALAYTNAVAYAAANSYVNTQLGLKANLASPTFTGTVTLPTVSANGGVGVSGQVLTSSGSGVYWSTPATGSGDAATAYSNAIAYAASNTYVNTQLGLKANLASPTFTGSTQIASLGVGTGASGSTGEIRATGDITAYYSDERLKNVVGEITGALEAVKQIRTFKYRANELAQSYGFDGSKVEIGISAQSLQRVYPELTKLAPFDSTVVDGKYVSTSGEEYLTAAYERLTVILIEAVKELADIVETKLK